MKKYQLLLLLPVMLMLTACPDPIPDDLVVKRQIDVTVQTSSLLWNFTSYTPSDMEMPEDAKLLIKAFVYDDNGKLVDTYYDVAEDYGATYSFSAAVAATHPTIVAFSYCIIGSVSSPEYQPYVISGENTLATLAVTRDNSYENIKWLVLGGCIETLNSTTKQLTLGLEPQGGVVYYRFKNIHAHDSEASAPDTYTFWHHSNDRLRISNNRFEYDCSLSTTYSFTEVVKPSDHADYNGVYGISFMMPGSFKTDATYDVGSTRTYFVEDKSIDVRAGKQYVVDIDCASYSMTFREGTIQ